MKTYRRVIGMLCALAAGQGVAAEGPSYGVRLEGFDYPHPVHEYAFTSQRTPVRMAYMDVAPTGPANGRTAVLLHGKNFCAATWEQAIAALSNNRN